MKKIIAIIVGLWFFFTGIQGLLIGETVGFGTMSVGANQVNSDDNPIEFVLSILFKLGLGGGLIKIGLYKKDIDE